MKKIVLIACLCLTCTGCVSINKELQAEFNQDATYFIQNDGATLIKYLDEDKSLTNRDK